MTDRVVIYKTTARPKIALQVLDAAGAPRDVTGWAMSARLGYLARTAIERSLVTWVTGGAVAITNGPQGLVEITYTTADLASVAPGTAYTLELKRTTGGSEEVLGQLACEVRESLHQ